MKDLSERAAAIRSLADLVRVGVALRPAMCRWHREAPPSCRAALARVGRRVRLGDSVAGALQVLDGDMGGDASVLRGVLRLHARLGGELATMLDGLAGAIEARNAVSGEARAAAAGPKLSARVVAVLPLVFVPLAPLTRTSFFDAVSLVTNVVGVGLALCGIAWIARLTPAPEDADDGVAVVADLTACALRGGIGLRAALDAVAACAPEEVRPQMMRARRLSRLGITWSEALSLAGIPSLRALSHALSSAHHSGLPTAAALQGFAERRRAELWRAMDARIRRAPVWMVFPLALCVLPAFLLLGVVPFLRGISPSP